MNATQAISVNLKDLEKQKQELINSEPELKKFDEEWEQEYQVRKKLRMAKEESTALFASRQ